MKNLAITMKRASVLFIFLISTMGATYSHAIDIPWTTVLSAAASYVSGKKHDKLIKEQIETVLQAIAEVNQKIDALAKQTCDIYAHDTFQDYEDFNVKLRSYVAHINKELFLDELISLKDYVTTIRKHFEDHSLLVSCAIDQYDTYQIYMLLMNLDLNLQAEYIRMLYYIAYLSDPSNPNGLLKDVSTLDPAVADEMFNLIEQETKLVVKERIGEQDLIQHLKVLDGLNGNMSWRQKSDSLFTGMTHSSVVTQWMPVYYSYWDYSVSPPQFSSSVYYGQMPAEVKNIYSYKRNGSRFEIVNYCWYSAYQVILDGFNRPIIANPISGSCGDFSPREIDTNEGVFDFMYLERDYYKASRERIYGRHKYEGYISYLEEVYSPTVPIIEEWYAFVDNEVAYPALSIDDHLNQYNDYKSIDTDMDGLTDVAELKTYKTNPNLADSDGDGIDDLFEVNSPVLDPNFGGDATGDYDNDGFTNIEEYLAGSDLSNPTSNPDSLLAAKLVPIISLLLN
jgi:hypothetical protein